MKPWDPPKTPKPKRRYNSKPWEIFQKPQNPHDSETMKKTQTPSEHPLHKRPQKTAKTRRFRVNLIPEDSGSEVAFLESFRALGL